MSFYLALAGIALCLWKIWMLQIDLDEKRDRLERDRRFERDNVLTHPDNLRAIAKLPPPGPRLPLPNVLKPLDKFPADAYTTREPVVLDIQK